MERQSLPFGRPLVGWRARRPYPLVGWSASPYPLVGLWSGGAPDVLTLWSGGAPVLTLWSAFGRVARQTSLPFGRVERQSLPFGRPLVGWRARRPYPLVGWSASPYSLVGLWSGGAPDVLTLWSGGAPVLTLWSAFGRVARQTSLPFGRVERQSARVVEDGVVQQGGPQVAGVADVGPQQLDGGRVRLGEVQVTRGPVQRQRLHRRGVVTQQHLLAGAVHTLTLWGGWQNGQKRSEPAVRDMVTGQTSGQDEEVNGHSRISGRRSDGYCNVVIIGEVAIWKTD